MHVFIFVQIVLELHLQVHLILWSSLGIVFCVYVLLFLYLFTFAPKIIQNTTNLQIRKKKLNCNLGQVRTSTELLPRGI